MQDAKSQTTSYTFDDNNRPLTVTDPQTNVLYTLTYDAIGRVATRKDGKNQTTTYTYTLRNQLDHLTYPNSTTVQYQYDGAGNRTSMVDGTGTTAYQYDALNRLSSVTFSGSKTVGYGYDADGNRAGITYPGGSHQVTYGYDTADRLTSVTDWNSKQTTYAYDNANRLTTATLPATNGTNNVTSSYTYDNANRLTGITHTLGATTLASATYTLDNVSNRTSRVTAFSTGGSQQTESYCYDVLNRLTTVYSSVPANCGSSGALESYGYDAVGNRTSMTTGAGTTSYSYDSADHLTTVTPPSPAGAIGYTYDLNGSVTVRGSDTFSWDAANRMTATSISGGASLTMAYNGDGLRASRTDTTTHVTTTFVWDILGSLILDDGSQYIYGASGLIEQVSGGVPYYFLGDGLGSTMLVVDGSAAIKQTYSYDVYGAATAGTNNHATEYQFAGQQIDATGMQYLRARYYDTSTGRFMSRDPLGLADPADHHAYSYTNDGPTSSVDPTGLDVVPWVDPTQSCPCYPKGWIDTDTGIITLFGNDGKSAATTAQQQIAGGCLSVENGNKYNCAFVISHPNPDGTITIVALGWNGSTGGNVGSWYLAHIDIYEFNDSQHAWTITHHYGKEANVHSNTSFYGALLAFHFDIPGISADAVISYCFYRHESASSNGVSNVAEQTTWDRLDFHVNTGTTTLGSSGPDPC